MSTITLENNTLVVQTPYNPALVMEIKALPYSERKWDPNRKAWLVDLRHGQKLAGWIAQYLSEMVLIPQAQVKASEPEMRLFDVRYIGVTKERSVGCWSAYGYCNGEWSLIFPESVLRGWFELMPEQKSGKPTLYGLLGIRNDVGPDELKLAFRRMARQWHPDACRDQNAADMFRQIKDAYDLLSDLGKRARYNAGLALEATVARLKDSYDRQPVLGYRTPLRCGYILAEATESIGRFEVTKIYQWEDVTDDQGRTLVTSWPAGAKQITESWV